MTRKLKDPEFGELDVPGPPTREEFEAVRGKVLEGLKAHRIWPVGEISKCPICNERALVGRDDLVERVTRPGGILVFRHLHGARCTSCQTQLLEPDEAVSIEADTGVGLVADFEAKVSSIGTGTLGTYWPRDVVRVLRLSPEKRAFIQVLDSATVLVRFEKRLKGPMAARGHKAIQPLPKQPSKGKWLNRPKAPARLRSDGA